MVLGADGKEIVEDGSSGVSFVPEFTSETVIGGSELEQMKKEFAEKVLKPKEIPAENLNKVVGSLLYSYAMRATSTKGTPGDSQVLVEFTVNGKKVSFTQREITTFLNTQKCLVGLPNKVRVFCRSLDQNYLAFCRSHDGPLPFISRANKLGIEAKHHFLSADFLTGNGLDVTEQAIVMFAREKATQNEVTNQRQLVNLSQLGKTV